MNAAEKLSRFCGVADHAPLCTGRLSANFCGQTSSLNSFIEGTAFALTKGRRNTAGENLGEQEQPRSLRGGRRIRSC